MSDEDESQKTEEPTEKRIRDAVEKGQVIQSKEINHFIMFSCLILISMSIFPFITKEIIKIITPFVTDFHDISFSNTNYLSLFANAIYKILLLMSMPFFILIIGIFLASYIQSGHFIFTTSTIMPKFDRINLFSGIKRILSFKSIFEFIKGILKITIISCTIFFTVKPLLTKIINIYNYDIVDIFLFIFTIFHKILFSVVITLAVIAAIDYFYQRFEYYKSMRMSKQDIKDEHKQLDGNPEIKAKLKKLRSERNKQNISQSVPKADVVINNPTHFSIALKYDIENMQAPILIAKGQDLIAHKIRELAKAHNIIQVQNPPLARSLYAEVEVNQEIPIEYYQAVAEVISYVYKQKKKQ